jgi:hypothetical protein
MSERPSTAVLGFRPHTYWTAVVAVAGPPEAPEVLERRRIVFATGAERFVYHQAETLDLRSAQTLLDTVRSATEANAAREIGLLLADLERDGVAVRDAVTPAATAKLADSLASILKSHAQMHAAEGSFYRDVIAQACAALGLQVHRLAERDMPKTVCGLLHVDGATLEAQLKAIGAALGPPWSEDYRLATEAAWTRLGA